MLDIGAREVQDQLRRILASDAFHASGRNRRFLEYVVGEALAGRADRIKAYSIATSVFGRGADFNPDLDSIVRIEAGRLRRALDDYYLTAGGADALRIAIPKGSYVPAFEPVQPGQPETAGAKLTDPRSGRRDPAILVMPFEEEGDQSAFPNFTSGFTRLLMVGLTHFTDLRVLGSATNLAFGSVDNARTLVNDCDVDFILTGGTTVSATGFSVEALLVESRTGRCLWAESFELTLDPTQLVSARGEVAGCIVRALAEPGGVIASLMAQGRFAPVSGSRPRDVMSQ